MQSTKFVCKTFQCYAVCTYGGQDSLNTQISFFFMRHTDITEMVIYIQAKRVLLFAD